MIITVLTISAGIAAQQALQQSTAVELSFLYTRLAGSASNQYAAWIEDAQGQYIKTLYATRWSANGGWRLGEGRRAASIPIWARQSNIGSRSREYIDAISSATPRTGTVTYTWDGTNSLGLPVPNGEYVLFLEGSLRWENHVLYRASFNLGQGRSTPVFSINYSGDSITERSMISDVKLQILR